MCGEVTQFGNSNFWLTVEPCEQPTPRLNLCGLHLYNIPKGSLTNTIKALFSFSLLFYVIVFQKWAPNCFSHSTFSFCLLEKFVRLACWRLQKVAFTCKLCNLQCSDGCKIIGGIHTEVSHRNAPFQGRCETLCLHQCTREVVTMWPWKWKKWKSVPF